ncbi:MAG: DUF1127 domain-containing protein [Gammaproteobacteria bacterium]|nr:DUF1127 domain-containing protein [Gammaproteobacteria bacterium]
MTTYAENSSARLGVGVFEGIYQRFQLWVEAQNLEAQVARERSELLKMSDSMLDDMGITWSEAGAEAGRVDVPEERMTTQGHKIC